MNDRSGHPQGRREMIAARLQFLFESMRETVPPAPHRAADIAARLGGTGLSLARECNQRRVPPPHRGRVLIDLPAVRRLAAVALRLAQLAAGSAAADDTLMWVTALADPVDTPREPAQEIAGSTRTWALLVLLAPPGLAAVWQAVDGLATRSTDPDLVLEQVRAYEAIVATEDGKDGEDGEDIGP